MKMGPYDTIQFQNTYVCQYTLAWCLLSVENVKYDHYVLGKYSVLKLHSYRIVKATLQLDFWCLYLAYKSDTSAQKTFLVRLYRTHTYIYNKWIERKNYELFLRYSSNRNFQTRSLGRLGASCSRASFSSLSFVGPAVVSLRWYLLNSVLLLFPLICCRSFDYSKVKAVRKRYRIS